MTKICRRFFVFLIFLALFFSRPGSAYGGYTQDDRGIQKVGQDKVWQITKGGKVQDHYTSESFFPLGLYHVDLGPVRDDSGNPQSQAWALWNLSEGISRNSLPEVIEGKFNTIFPVHLLPNAVEMALINNYGLKIWAMLLHTVINDACGNHPDDCWESNWTGLRSAINAYKDNPAILGWYMWDENYSPWGAHITLAKWLEAYQVVKSIDPIHPLFSSGGGGGCSGATEDLRVVTSYPSYSGDTDWAIDGIFRNNCPLPVWTILQAFGNVDPGNFVLPTRAILRSQYYIAITHGATGIMLFIQHTPWVWELGKGIPYTPYTQIPSGGAPGENLMGINPYVNVDLWNTAKQLNGEVEQYKQVFLSLTAKDDYHVFYENSLGSVHTILKEGEWSNIRYLLGVGMDTSANWPPSIARNVRFTFPREITQITPIMGGSISLLDDKKTIQTSFNDLEVKFLKIEYKDETPTPFIGINDLRQAMTNFINIFDINNIIANYGKSSVTSTPTPTPTPTPAPHG